MLLFAVLSPSRKRIIRSADILFIALCHVMFSAYSNLIAVHVL